jgi:hypothetical protein
MRLLLTSLALVVLGSSPARGAGQCPSTKAASELSFCSHCQVLKELVRGSKDADIHMDVFDLQHGVVVQLTGANEEAIDLIHRVVDDIWLIPGDAEVASTTHVCADCSARIAKLETAERDRALTDVGAVVVLKSADPALVKWLQQDSRQYQGWLRTVDTTR